MIWLTHSLSVCITLTNPSFTNLEPKGACVIFISKSLVSRRGKIFHHRLLNSHVSSLPLSFYMYSLKITLLDCIFEKCLMSVCVDPNYCMKKAMLKHI